MDLTGYLGQTKEKKLLYKKLYIFDFKIIQKN